MTLTAGNLVALQADPTAFDLLAGSPVATRAWVPGLRATFRSTPLGFGVGTLASARAWGVLGMTLSF